MGKSPSVLIGLIRFADVAAIPLCALLTYWLRHGLEELPGRYWLLTAICTLVAIQVFHSAGLYRFRLAEQPIGSIAKLTTAWAIVGLVLIALLFFTKTAEEFSRVWAASWLSTTYVVFLAIRLAVYLRLSLLQRGGRLIRNVAVVGAGDHGRRLIRHLNQQGQEHGLRIVGVFDDRKTRVPTDMLDGIPVRGDTDALLEACRNDEVDIVVLALPWSSEHRLSEMILKLRQVPVDLQLAPEQIAFRLADRPTTQLGGLPMLSVSERPISGWNRILKAVEDRTLALLMLIVLAPAMALIALLIKLDSPGPVLFRQQRFGFNNNLIIVKKFRTMQHRPEGGGDIVQARRDDPRVTRFGAFLRRSSLDELPQLLNVLDGSMSIVGPRPHAVAHNHQFAASVRQYYARHRVKPGITGWAQVHGLRGETDTREKLEKRVEHDLYYIDNWSLLLDLKIIIMTLFVGFVNEHAY